MKNLGIREAVLRAKLGRPLAQARLQLGHTRADLAGVSGQRGKLQNEPAYRDAKWRMQAKCG